MTLPLAPVERHAERGRLAQSPFVIAQQGDAVRSDGAEVGGPTHDDELVELGLHRRIDRPGDEGSTSDACEKLLAGSPKTRPLSRSKYHPGDRHRAKRTQPAKHRIQAVLTDAQCALSRRRRQAKIQSAGRTEWPRGERGG